MSARKNKSRALRQLAEKLFEHLARDEDFPLTKLADPVKPSPMSDSAVLFCHKRKAV